MRKRRSIAAARRGQDVGKPDASGAAQGVDAAQGAASSGGLARSRALAPMMLALGGLLLTFAIGLLPLLRGDAVPVSDAEDFFAPYYILLADHSRAGAMMLWDPWTEAGMPIAAEPQTGAFCPVTVLFSWLTGPTLAGFVVYWISVWLLGAVGMLLLARRLGAPAWGALVAALGFGFSGLHFGNAQHTSWIFSFSFVPWIILCLDRALLHRRLFAAVGCGVLVGLSALAGYPGLVVANLGLVALWTAGRWVCRWDDDVARPPRDNRARRHDAASAIRLLLVVMVVAAVVMSPVYAALVVETKGFTERAEVLARERAVEENALAPVGLLTVASPYLPSLQWINPTWTYTDPSSLGLYIGGITLWLALVGLAAARGPWRWWLLGIAVLGLAMALGRALPLRGWLYDLLPPFRYFRHASLFRAYFIFAGSALAAVGSKEIARQLALRPAGWSASLAISGAMAAVVNVAFYYVASGCVAEHGADAALAGFHLWAVWSLVAALAVGGAIPRFRRVYCLIFPWLVCAGAVGDALFTARLSRLTCFTAHQQSLDDWRNLQQAHWPALDLKTRSGWQRWPKEPAETNKHLVVKLPVLRGYPATFANSAFNAWIAAPSLASRLVDADRVFFTPAAAWARPDLMAPEAIAARAAETKSLPALVDSASGAAEAQAKPAADLKSATDWRDVPLARPLSVQLSAYRPDCLAFEADCPTKGWLIVTDRWARGWQATVNDAPTRVWRCDGLFRAIPVSRGLNRIRFDYRPFGYPSLLILSWSIVGLCAAVGLLRLRPRRAKAG